MLRSGGLGFRVRDLPVLGVSLLISRLSGRPLRASLIRPVVVESEDGLRWHFGNTEAGTDDWLAFSAHHEKSITKLLTDLSQSTKKFVDVGAHVGRYSVRLATHVVAVTAFDPNPTSRKILLENLRLNGVNKCEVLSFALGSEEGRAHLIERGGSSRLVQSGDGDVQVRPMDALNLDPELIKVDTEGYEVEVLGGAIETLRRCRPKLLIEVHADSNFADCVKIINEVGYSRVEKMLDGNEVFIWAEP